MKYLIEDVGLKFDELVVFLDISDAWNEAFDYCLDKNDNVISQHPETEPPASMSGQNKVIWLKQIIHDNLMFSYYVINAIHDFFVEEKIEGKVEEEAEEKHGFSRPMSLWTVNKDVFQEYGQEGLDKMRLYMDRLFSLTQKHNIKLSVAVYPWPDQIWYGDLNSVQVSFWNEWCKKRNINFINYFGDFIGEGQNEEEKAQIVDKYFVPGDVHWNKDGHKLIANRFLEK